VKTQTLFARLGGISGIGGEKLHPMGEAEIAAFEEELGIRLPDAYRRFLATYGASTFNGASPDNPYILFRPLKPLPPQFQSGKGLFHAFYGQERDGHDAFSLRVRTRFFSGRMPESIIPIGDDGMGGQICLGVKGAEAGRIYYWDQQREPLDEQDYLADFGHPRPPGAAFQNVHLIAESFEDFLQRLETKVNGTNK
jgi:hypothetical protein